jgi:kinesin family protein C2/C3
LAESAAANAALASQLEHLSPQLSALERAHAATKDRLKEEATLRRNAELRSEELQHKCRELEASLVHAREEQDALHEELAFRDSELEETRLELEVERERREAQQQQQEQQQNGAVVVALDASITEEERISDEFPNNAADDNTDYVKRLEDELEVVTEQLIETEQKLSKTQEELLDAQQSLLLAQQQAKKNNESHVHDDDNSSSSIVLQQDHLKEELTKSREEALEWQQRVQLVTEELALAREELGAAEEDVQAFGDKMDRARKEHREEVRRVQAELERAVTDRDAYRAELETLEGTLQATVEENVSLKQECENLQTALDHAKRDSASVVQELEEVNARFDQVKQEAERVGQERAARLVREELLQSHREEMKALQAQFQTLQAANADLQETVDVVETALAAERDKQHALDAAAPPSASSEVQEKLQSQLERTRDELLQKSQEVEMLKSSFEQRVVKAEKDVTRLEQELSKTRGKLAEAEANLIVIRREKERAAAAIPAKRGLTDDESRDDSGRNGITHRSRSMSPTSPERLEQRASEEHVKLKELQEEYGSLKKQYQMSQVHVKRLEEDLNTLQMQVFATNGEATVATQMSRISSTLASKQNAGDDLTDDRGGSDVVEQVIQSGDPEVMAEELRKVDKKSTQQREHNAQLLNKILSLQGNIQVCCRVRPLRMNEIQQGSKSAVETFSETEVGCFDARANKWKSFGFDKVWGPDQSQLDVFQDVEPLALSVVDGYNACIFAYGQT